MEFYGIKMEGDFETDNIKAKDSTGIAVTDDSATKIIDLEDGGTVSLNTGTSVNEFSIDGTLAGNSDNAVPTEKATKTYVDGKFPITSAQVSDWDEAVQDTAGAALSASSGITVNYSDALASLQFSHALSGGAGITITDDSPTSGITSITMNTTEGSGLNITDAGAAKNFALDFVNNTGITITDVSNQKKWTLDSPTITLSGDVTGSALLNQLQNMNIVTTIANPAVPAGTKMLFVQASAPTGWNKVTTYQANSAIVLNVNADGDTLTASGGRFITISHGHNVTQAGSGISNSGNHGHNSGTGTTIDPSSNSLRSKGISYSSKRFVTSVSSGGGHSPSVTGGGVTADNVDPVYTQQVIICQKS